MDTYLLNHGNGADVPPRNSGWQGKFVNDKIPLRTLTFHLGSWIWTWVP